MGFLLHGFFVVAVVVLNIECFVLHENIFTEPACNSVDMVYSMRHGGQCKWIVRF